jgi:hypothetical protein
MFKNTELQYNIDLEIIKTLGIKQTKKLPEFIQVLYY